MLEPGSTKELIFDVALELVARHGYDAVTIRDIAKGVGIKGSSIYNHYESKALILQHFYDYYTAFLYESRAEEEAAKAIIRIGSLTEIIKVLSSGSFSEIEGKRGVRMMLLAKVVYSRIYIDEKAASIHWNNMLESRRYIKDIIDYGVEIKRFREFDTEGFATSFVALYTNMGVEAFIQPDYSPGPLEREKKIAKWMGRVLELNSN